MKLSKRTVLVAVSAGASLSLLASPAAGHGYMCFPAGRNALNHCGFPEQPRNYDVMGLNAGGPGKVYAQPGEKHYGLCGDPFDGVQEHMVGGKYANGVIAATFQKGQQLSINVKITAHHKGAFQFQLCNLGPHAGSMDAVTEECFVPLQQMDGSGPNWPLPAPELQGDYYTINTFRLPDDVVCERCVLRWYWRTGNSDPTPTPEEFWNCADIAITEDGSVPPPSPSPPSPPSTPSPPSPPAPSPPSPPAPTGSPDDHQLCSAHGCSTCMREWTFEGTNQLGHACYHYWDSNMCSSAQVSDSESRYFWCNNLPPTTTATTTSPPSPSTTASTTTTATTTTTTAPPASSTAPSPAPTPLPTILPTLPPTEVPPATYSTRPTTAATTAEPPSQNCGTCDGCRRVWNPNTPSEGSACYIGWSRFQCDSANSNPNDIYISCMP